MQDKKNYGWILILLVFTVLLLYFGSSFLLTWFIVQGKVDVETLEPVRTECIREE